MNLNLVDLSSNIKTEFKGQFNDVVTKTINNLNGTNFSKGLLERENWKMDNTEFLKGMGFAVDNNQIDIIGDLSKNTGVAVEEVQTILSELINMSTEFTKKGGLGMGESLQIGDKIEIHNSGNGPNNYAGMLNSYGVIKELKTRISDLHKLLSEKDALIAAQKETIELLKSK